MFLCLGDFFGGGGCSLAMPRRLASIGSSGAHHNHMHRDIIRTFHGMRPDNIDFHLNPALSGTRGFRFCFILL